MQFHDHDKEQNSWTKPDKNQRGDFDSRSLKLELIFEDLPDLE